jgi:hypothetical protein
MEFDTGAKWRLRAGPGQKDPGVEAASADRN